MRLVLYLEHPRYNDADWYHKQKAENRYKRHVHNLQGDRTRVREVVKSGKCVHVCIHVHEVVIKKFKRLSYCEIPVGIHAIVDGHNGQCHL